ncbi:MAG: DUF92 domain-containing protein [Candidatus Anstonellales archaeon]
MIGLDSKGIVAAIVLASLIYYFTNRLEYILGFILFLTVSNYITLFNAIKKIKLRSFERTRGLSNVISNGLVPAVFAILNNPVGYLGGLAAITSDKFSSELGVFDNRVYTIIGFKKTIPGKSGAISLYGTVSGMFGSMIIALFGILAFNLTLDQSIFIFLAGIMGNIADSIAGHFEERGIGTKGTSNLIGSSVGALTALLFLQR